MTGELIPLTGAVRPHPHLRIAKFSQHFVDVLDLNLSPLDYFMALWPDLTREDCRKFLGRFGISGSVQTQLIGQLSDGQKSRVVLAKMAKEAPHVLFLDEPTNHLDMESIDSLAKAINQFTGGMILVSHDMRLISQVAKEIWLCDNHTVAKYVGEINDFKMQLRNQINNNEAGNGKKEKLPVAPLVPKSKMQLGGPPEPVLTVAPLLAPLAPTVNAPKPPPTTAEQMASLHSTLAKSLKKSSAAGNDEEDEDIDGEEGMTEFQKKEAAKARRKAEKEAANAFKAKENEEREWRRIEKLREQEEARELKEKILKEREEEAKKKAMEEVSHHCFTCFCFVC
jgi:energy-coupling factor transporter ATP-binding protein EcfA2